MKDFYLLLTGALLGAGVAVTVLNVMGVEERWRDTNAMLQTCQNPLPRNKICVLIAVPKTTN